MITILTSYALLFYIPLKQSQWTQQGEIINKQYILWREGQCIWMPRDKTIKFFIFPQKIFPASYFPFLSLPPYNFYVDVAGSEIKQG